VRKRIIIVFLTLDQVEKAEKEKTEGNLLFKEGKYGKFHSICITPFAILVSSA
jgi:hypothetical protein